MKGTIVTAVAAVILCGVSALAAEEKFGAGVTLKDATPIAKLLESPAGYVGKTCVSKAPSAPCARRWAADGAQGRGVRQVDPAQVDDGSSCFP